MALHVRGPIQIPECLASRRYLADYSPSDRSRASTTLLRSRSPTKASWSDPYRDRILPLPHEQSKKHETFDDLSRLAHRRRQDPPSIVTTSYRQRPASPELPRKDSVQSQQSLPDTTKLRPLLDPQAPTTSVLPGIDRSPHSPPLKRPASDLGSDHGNEQYEQVRRGWSAEGFSPKTTKTPSPHHSKYQLPLTPPADHAYFPRMSMPHLLGPRVSERAPHHASDYDSHNSPPYINHPPPTSSLSPPSMPSIPDPLPGSTVLPSHNGNRVEYKGICHTPQGDFYTYEDGSLVPTHVGGEPVNPAWGLTKANRPRKRLPKACRACRDEKSRCEPTRSGCMRCDVTGRTCRS